MRFIALIVGQFLYCRCWGGSCTATPGRQYNCRPNRNYNFNYGWLLVFPILALIAGVLSGAEAKKI